MSKVDIFKKIPKFKFEEKAVKTNSAEFCKVAESRRSVRVYTEEKIPEDVMKKCLCYHFRNLLYKTLPKFIWFPFSKELNLKLIFMKYITS